MKFAGFIQALTSVVLSIVRNALTLVISLFLLCYLVGFGQSALLNAAVWLEAGKAGALKGGSDLR